MATTTGPTAAKVRKHPLPRGHKQPNESHGHRRSLRLAMRESLRDASAAAVPINFTADDSGPAPSVSHKSPSTTRLKHSLNNSRRRPRSANSTTSSASSHSTGSSSLSHATSAVSSAEPATQPQRGKNRATRGDHTTKKSKGGSLPSSSACRGGWHRIKEIVGEGRDRGDLVYLVEWEGSDPKSGTMWPCSWVSWQCPTFG